MRTWTGANVVFLLVVLGYPWCNCALRHAKLNKPPAGWGEKDNGLSWVGLLSELELEQGVRGLGWHLQLGRQIMKLLGEWGAPGLAKLQKNDKRPNAESATPPSSQCFLPYGSFVQLSFPTLTGRWEVSQKFCARRGWTRGVRRLLHGGRRAKQCQWSAVSSIVPQSVFI